MGKDKKEIEFLILLGARIAQIRKERKIKQIELAAYCEIERQNLRRIEAGLTNPTALTLRKIAEGIGVPPSELWNFDTGGKAKTKKS